MRVYIVTYIIEEESWRTVNVGVFGDKAKAEKYVAEHQETFKAPWGDTLNRYSIERWEVSY